jgi:hypothetical protein
MNPGTRQLRRVAVLAALGLSACPPSSPPPPVTPSPGSLQVVFPGLGGPDRPLLLYSGTEAGECVSFEPHIGTPSVNLSGITWDPACPVEIDVFTPGFGSYGQIADPLSPGGSAWFTNALAAGTLSIGLGPVQTIPLAIWIVADAGDRPAVEDLASRQFASAGPILEDLGPGFTLDTTTNFLNVGQVAPDCASAGFIGATAGVYDPRAINVYYVKNYLNVAYSNYAMNCWMQGQPEIIFVSWGNKFTPDVALAHEVGHALGLVSPNAVGGHTNTVSGFDPFNLMYSGAATVTNVSVGQSYATNFSDKSWLNRPGSATPSSVSRDCQDSWTTGPCPTLKLFVPTWP